MVFKLSWSWYEDHNFWLFESQTKTTEEFDADVESLLKKYADEYMAQEKSWVMVPSWIKYVAEKLTSLGYVAVEPHTWGFWGGYILGDDKARNKEDLAWGKIVGKKLLDKAVKHNAIIKKEMGD